MAGCAQGATPGWWGQEGGLEPLHPTSPHGRGTVAHGDSRAGPAGANPTATQLLAMLRPPQDSTSHVTGASHVTVLPLRLHSVSTYLYDYEISGPLGRDNYKEMYLFIYR